MGKKTQLAKPAQSGALANMCKTSVCIAPVNSRITTKLRALSRSASWFIKSCLLCFTNTLRRVTIENRRLHSLTLHECNGDFSPSYRSVPLWAAGGTSSCSTRNDSARRRIVSSSSGVTETHPFGSISAIWTKERSSGICRCACMPTIC